MIVRRQANRLRVIRPLSSRLFIPARGNAQKTGRSQPTAPRHSLRLLLIIGGLAIASSVAVPLVNDRKGPRESLEASLMRPTKDNISVIFVVGFRGSGKSTQCSNLAKDYGFVHLRIGDLLREEVKQESTEAKIISKCIQQGKLVPKEITIGLLDRTIHGWTKQGRTKFLVDGFPRQLDQVVAFEKEVAPIDYTLYFECPQKVIFNRLKGREDLVSSEQFQALAEANVPIVDYFKNSGKLLTIQCDSGDAQQVNLEIQKALKVRG
jgi:UMP-CMP kinase